MKVNYLGARNDKYPTCTVKGTTVTVTLSAQNFFSVDCSVLQDDSEVVHDITADNKNNIQFFGSKYIATLIIPPRKYSWAKGKPTLDPMTGETTTPMVQVPVALDMSEVSINLFPVRS